MRRHDLVPTDQRKGGARHVTPLARGAGTLATDPRVFHRLTQCAHPPTQRRRSAAKRCSHGTLAVCGGVDGPPIFEGACVRSRGAARVTPRSSGESACARLVDDPAHTPGGPHEEDVPTQHPTARTTPRVPASHVGSRRPQGAALTSAQGPSTPQRVIVPLSRSAEFQRLKRNGRRVRTGPMTLIALPDTELDHPTVAFSIRRAYGTAVRRNRARRRLRAVCRELDAAGAMPPGLYLMSPRRDLSDLDHLQLTSCVADAVRPVSS